MNLKSLVFLLLLHRISAHLPEVTCLKAVKTIGEGWTCPSAATIGRGSYGITYLVTHPKHGKAVLKVAFDFWVDSSNQIVPLEKEQLECSIIQMMSSKNIVKCLKFKRDSNFVFSLIEYGEKGDLRNWILSDPEFFEDQRNVMGIFRQVLGAVREIHSKKMVHADIKSENIVMTGRLYPKLIDFEMAVPFRTPGNPRGTRLCAAPEIILRKPFAFGPEIDLYSLGVLLFEMLHKGAPPFVEGVENAWKYRIYPKLPVPPPSLLQKGLEKGDYSPRQGLELNVLRILENCLAKDPQQRGSLDKIITLVNEFFAKEEWIVPNQRVLNNQKFFYEGDDLFPDELRFGMDPWQRIETRAAQKPPKKKRALTQDHPESPGSSSRKLPLLARKIKENGKEPGGILGLKISSVTVGSQRLDFLKVLALGLACSVCLWNLMKDRRGKRVLTTESLPENPIAESSTA